MVEMRTAVSASKKIAMVVGVIVVVLVVNSVFPAVLLDRHLETQSKLLPTLQESPLTSTQQRVQEVQQSLEALQAGKMSLNKKRSNIPGTQRQKLPHILFVLADDLGNDDLSTTQQLLRTPVLHNLAQNGLYLQNYYTQSLCSPSRAAFNTGRYPARFGMQTYVLMDEQQYGMDLQERTLPQTLQTLGYHTHLLGKWHLGYQSWRRTPNFRGYDSFHGYYSGQGTYVTHQATKYFDYHLDTEPDIAAFGVHSHELYVSRCKNILDNHMQSASSSPLFVHLALQSPHSPHEAPADPFSTYYERNEVFTESSQASEEKMSVYEIPGERLRHAALLTYMDDTIGRVVELFKKSGIWNQTLFVFASDNGGCVTNLAPGCAGGASNFPFRGEKGTLYEGGVHVPAFIYSANEKLLPEHLRGKTSVERIHVTDWFPTIIGSIQGAGAETSHLNLSNVDGINVWPRLKEGAQCPSVAPTAPNQECCHTFDQCQLRPTFNRTILLNHDPYLEGSGLISGKWKLAIHSSRVRNSGWSVRNGGMNFAPLATTATAQLELFDLESDPEERNNIAETELEIVAALVKQLKDLTHEFEVPLAPSEEDNYFMGNPLADSVAVASSNTMHPWIVE